MKKLKFSPEQIQFLAQINNKQEAAPEVVELKEIEEQSATPTPPPKQNLISEEPVEAEKTEVSSDEKTESEKSPAAPKKKATPIDKVEKDQQPADNDDDEKLADNHRK